MRKPLIFPVRIGFELVWVVVTIFIIMMGWYITQPMLMQTLGLTQNMTEDMNVNTTQSGQTYSLLKRIVVWWGPVFVLILLIFAVVASQRRELRGYYE